MYTPRSLSNTMIMEIETIAYMPTILTAFQMLIHAQMRKLRNWPCLSN